jgi:hypothetical protein
MLETSLMLYNKITRPNELFRFASYNRVSGFASFAFASTKYLGPPTGGSAGYQPPFWTLPFGVRDRPDRTGDRAVMKKVGRTYQVIVHIFGEKISLGPYEYRSQATIAEEVVGKIRYQYNQHQKSDNRSKDIQRFRFREETRMKTAPVIEPGFWKMAFKPYNQMTFAERVKYLWMLEEKRLKRKRKGWDGSAWNRLRPIEANYAVCPLRESDTGVGSSKTSRDRVARLSREIL